MARDWTDQETRALLMGLGAYGKAWFRERSGTSSRYPNAPSRSESAIRAKIARLCHGVGKLTRGAYTLHRLARESGYSRTQIKRAQSALNQKWKRTSPRGAHLVTEDQAEEIKAWLQHDFWNRDRRLYCCVQCHDDGGSAWSWGMCRRCYDRVRYAVGKLSKIVQDPHGRKSLDDFVKKVQVGRGFQWRQLRELTKRLSSG